MIFIKKYKKMNNSKIKRIIFFKLNKVYCNRIKSIKKTSKNGKKTINCKNRQKFYKKC